MAYFADKTIGMIRAPDEYPYPAPFNLIELVLIAPFEYVVDHLALYYTLTQYTDTS